MSRSGTVPGVTAIADRPPLGELLRDWRQRRRLSQLDLALEAGVSARHLSFLETGRSKPSREMVLGWPRSSRSRCATATACCWPPASRPPTMSGRSRRPRWSPCGARSPRCSPATSRSRPRSSIAGGTSSPRTATSSLFLEGVAPGLLEPPANVLRVSLHPEGMAPRIANLAEWRGHLLDRLRREVSATADARLAALLAELESYPAPAAAAPPRPAHGRHRRPAGAPPRRARELSFFSTVATFGTAVDVTVAELSIEAFFPADAVTAAFLHESLPKR